MPSPSDLVDQPALARLHRADGQAFAHHRLRRVQADAPRQQVGPVLAAVQVAHVAVVEVEHDPGAHPHAVRSQREERATRPMEKLLWEIPGVEYVYSTSKPSESLVIVRFKVGEDMERSIVKLNQKLQQNFDRIPHGVTGHITPWNYPVMLLARTVAPALAMGNAAVLKPSEETSISSVMAAMAATEAGVHDGVLNIVPLGAVVQQIGGNALHVVRRNPLHPVDHFIETELAVKVDFLTREVRHAARCALESQHEAPLEMVLRPTKFGIGDALVLDPAQFGHHHVDELADGIVGAPGVDRQRARITIGAQTAEHRVGEAPLLAHVLKQARTHRPAEDSVEHVAAIPVVVILAIATRAQTDVTLFEILRANRRV